MKLFNAFQAVLMFCLMPLVIQWVDGAEFTGHVVAYYGAWTVYTIMFVAAIYVVWEFMEKKKC